VTIVAGALGGLGLIDCPPASALPTVTTEAFFDSTPGEYIGAGKQYVLPTVTVSGTESGTVELQVSNASDSFTIGLAAAPGQNLVPGTYENVQRTASRTAGHPGLDVYGDARGCSTVDGRFVVDDATYDLSGNVLTFSARFESHCDTSIAALFGVVSYHSTAPYRTRSAIPGGLSFNSSGGAAATNSFSITNNGPAALTPAYTINGIDAPNFSVTTNTCGSSLASGASCTIGVTYTPGTGATAYAYLHYSDELAPLGSADEPAQAGQGWRILLTGNGGGGTTTGTAGVYPLTAAYLDAEPGSLIGQSHQIVLPTVRYTGLRGAGAYPMFQATSPTHSFDLSFAAPAGSPLIPGTYEDAQRFGFQAAGHPGLDVSGDSLGCNTVAGRFVVDEATYDGNGDVLTFSVRFELHCEGGSVATFGALSFDSSKPFHTRDLAPTAVDVTSPNGSPGSAPLTITNDGPSSLTPSVVSITGSNAADFAVTGNTCPATLAAGASCTLTITYTPSTNSSEGAVLAYSDELAPLGSPSETAGAGSGRHVALSGSIVNQPAVSVCAQGSDDQTFYCGDVADNPGGTTYGGKLSPVTDGNYDYVYARGSDGHLYQFSDATGSSQTTDVTAATTGGPTISSSPSAVFDGSNLQVFAVASDSGHLVDYENNGASGSWTVTDLNAAEPGSPLVTGFLSPTVLGVVHLYADTVAGTLVEIDNDNLGGHAWNFYDLSSFVGGGVPVSGAPGPVLIGGVPHIYIRASGSSDLLEFVADHMWGHIWNAYDQTTGQGAPTLSGDPIPLLIGDTPHVYLDDAATGDLVEVIADHLWGRIWNAYDQTRESGAPTLTGDPSAILVNGIPEVFENAGGTLVEVAADHQYGNTWNAYAFNTPQAISGDPSALIGEQGAPELFYFLT
jgi:hypothetical protein